MSMKKLLSCSTWLSHHDVVATTTTTTTTSKWTIATISTSMINDDIYSYY